MPELFFELIQLSMGRRDVMSRIPSTEEWKELFEMGMKQSLCGVCFPGVRKLYGLGCGTIPEELYNDWMGVAMKLTILNEKVSSQCLQLQRIFSEKGLRSCVLKGQGNALLYDKELSGLRNAGDIDLWVDAPKDKVVSLAKEAGITGEASYLHVGVAFFKDTEVELHWRPSYMRNPVHNARMQKWFSQFDWDSLIEREGMAIPPFGFNAVFQLSHIYRHLFGSGIGLRQMMDYYFLLKSERNSSGDVVTTLTRLGLLPFAGAVMYVMKEIFLLEDEYLISPVDEKRGKALIDEILSTGNFGNYDQKQKASRRTFTGKLKWTSERYFRMIGLYPSEVMFSPYWKFKMLLYRNGA